MKYLKKKSSNYMNNYFISNQVNIKSTINKKSLKSHLFKLSID